jgi:outer membrane protein assembly factor BamA
VKNLLFIFLFSLLPGITEVFAQEAIPINFVQNDTADLDKAIIKSINKKRTFSNENEKNREIQSLLLLLYSNGFLEARIDSVVQNSSEALCYITSREKYKWANLRPGNVSEDYLTAAGFREKIYFQKPVNFKDVERLGSRLIKQAENSGFPFSSFKLDSVNVNEHGHIQAALNLSKNKKIIVDSIVIVGNAKINPAYLHNYIGIKPGDLYNESQFKKINARIKELPFVRETRAHEMIFTESISKLVFYLDHRPTGRFDGILGILPNDETPGKVLITGDLQLRLLNSFGSGELIDLNWRKLQNETQDLRTQVAYPFLFSTPFGIDAKLDLYKRDTTFVNINPTLGINYMLSGANYFKVFVQQKSSRILSTSGLENLRSLPPYGDIKTTIYGIAFKFEKLDYRLNPRRGYRVFTSTGAGNRKIIKHPKINEEVYENVPLNSVQYDLNLNTEIFIPLGKRSTFKLGTNSSYLHSATAFENELYRIGGLKTLRGFDEESIFASSFSILTFEARYLLEQNSYLHVFWDGAWYENRTHDKFITDTPMGFGAGMSFETKAGIFSFSYALGKQFDNPIQLRSGKIHFGILNFF